MVMFQPYLLRFFLSKASRSLAGRKEFRRTSSCRRLVTDAGLLAARFRGMTS